MRQSSQLQLLCFQGRKLIDEYIAILYSHAKNVRQYSNAVRALLDGDLLEMVERRVQESRERVTLARKRYIAHIREHRCDSVLKKDPPTEASDGTRRLGKILIT
jgi:hypothetical protein